MMLLKLWIDRSRLWYYTDIEVDNYQSRYSHTNSGGWVAVGGVPDYILGT